MKATKLLTLLILLSGIFATNVLQNTQEELTKKNNETYQDYFLECKQIISGKVVDKNTNSVISNALVTLFLNGEEIKIAKVNKNGEYSFTVNCNLNYKIVVTAENYFKETYQLITTNTNNTINKRNFYLQNECFQTITGTVINQLTDEIITTAALTLFLNGQEVENIEVDSNGLYSFKVRCDSNYYIKVAKQNYITDIYEFKTSTNVNNVNHHNFILEPECVQTISGTILNKVTNEPISATLKLMLNNVEIERIEVNNDGKYSVKFQCTTNYKIVATKPNFFEDSYNFLTDYIELNQPDYFHLKKNLYLEPNECFQTVSGTVLNANTNAVIENATVVLIYQNQEIKTFQTNEDGSYLFNVKCDHNYELKAIKETLQSELTNYKASSVKNEKGIQDLFITEESCSQIISGIIVDKNTGLTIPNSQVALLEGNLEIDSVTVDASGKFNFTVECDKNYTINAVNNDYNSASTTFSTNNTRNANISKTLELVPLDCNQTVTGNVVDKNTGLTVANSQITLMEGTLEVDSTTADASGKFNFTVECDKNYTINVSNSNYNQASTSFSTNNTRDANISKTLELVPLDCNQTITGTVVDKNTGLTVANSQITLMEGTLEVDSTTADASGKFNFTVECDKNYTVNANNSDYNSASTTFSTNNTRDANISKTLELVPLDCNQTLTGTVVDKNTGLAIPNSQVALFESNLEIDSVTSDASGKFNFTVECDKNYTVNAVNNDYNSASTTFSTNNTRDANISKTLELVPLDCNQTVTGTVVDKNTGLTVANSQITLMEGTLEVDKTISNTNGVFTFELNCKKNYTLVGEHENYYIKLVQLSTDTERNKIHNLTINLSEKECNQTVTGIIRDKITKKPLPNTTISLYQNYQVIETATVGADGVYEFKINCASTYKLTVFKNNNLESFRIRTAKDNERVLTLHIDIEPPICKQYINGTVVENLTNNAIPNAKVSLFNSGKKLLETITDSNGTFYFEIDCNKDYEIRIDKANYTKGVQKITSPNTNAFSNLVEITLEPIIKFTEKNGVKYIETKPIIFELDEYELSNEAKIELNKVVYNLNQHPTIKIDVNFHTDSRGPDAYNMELTIKRAETTKDYLVSKGINPQRIIANGYGETRLLNRCSNNVNCSESEHAVNRRAEFIVLFD